MPHASPGLLDWVIPEVAVSKADYHEKILEPIYKDIAPIDPKKVLQEEWLNARGCIARFERNTIEIRVIDTQEHPTADLAILQAIVHVLKKLAAEEGLMSSMLFQPQISTKFSVK